MANKKKKEEKYKVVDINLFNRIELIVSLFVGIIFLVMLGLAISNEVFIPATLISFALFLFCISYYYMEDESKKKLVYALFTLGILLIVAEVVYTIVRIV